MDLSRLPEKLPANDLLIRNVILISPEREAPSEATNVLMREGRIVEIGRELSQGTHGSEQVIDGAGRYLTPGLIDAHTHLSEVPGMIFKHETAYPKIARDARRQIPRSYLYYGFTTVIDLIARSDVIAKWNNLDVRPHAYFCGAAPIFDGYPMSFIPKPFRYRIMPYFLFDETRAMNSLTALPRQSIRRKPLSKRMHADGAICVKTTFERGFGDKDNLPVPTTQIIRDLVAAAHARGIPVLLHANSQSAQVFGLEADIDVFAHGMWKWDDKESIGMNAEITQILDVIIQRNIAWQPQYKCSMASVTCIIRTFFPTANCRTCCRRA